MTDGQDECTEKQQATEGENGKGKHWEHCRLGLRHFVLFLAFVISKNTYLFVLPSSDCANSVD